MYAILQHGGHQYRVASGDRILVDRIPVEVGSVVTLESVLLIGDGAETDVAKGSPVEASVTATVIAHRRGRKIRVFSYKPKKRHRRTLGYRSQLTELLIDEVGRGKADTKPKAAAPKRAAAPKAAKPDAVAAEAAQLETEAKAIAAEAQAVETEVAVAELAVEEAAEAADKPVEKAAAPKRARTPKPKKEPADGA
ncbi:MAG: 50S ribosomal protein L21 [Candidatus Dormibacteria bacterium]|jgi:large subunit ribosomal protein L21